ncbi:hypothetical protein Taro_012202 [Colocasia esculenta]|uniref:Uncharacterized protein n=1 Tax=Colocasia esculenta TaxID=4460 RepID=A0A843UIF6_COLES|nr:hypothetical protein [Colocasia esculenta]
MWRVPELQPVLLGQEKELWQFAGRFGGLKVFLACSRREDLAWSGGNIGYSLFFAFSTKAIEPPVAFRTQQVDPSHSGYERDISLCHVLKYDAYRGYLFSWVPQVLCEPGVVLGACPGTYVLSSALVVGSTDTSRCTGPQLVLFPVPHSGELMPESLEVPGIRLRQCSPLVWC